MSLMFDALKAMDAPAGGSAAPAAGRPARVGIRHSPWLLFAAGAGASLLGVGLWMALRPASSQPAPPPMPAAVATTAVTPPAPTIAHPAPAAPAVAPLPAVPAATTIAAAPHADPAPQPPETASTAAVPRPAAATATTTPDPVAVASPSATQAPEPTAAPVEHRMPAAARVSSISVRNADDRPPTAEDPSVAVLVAAIGNAVHAGDFAAADRQLAQLEHKLPPRSLTLLRMQAWVAHTRGDAANAIALYRKIVNRMPDDQTTAINLAILEAENGQAESARARLQQLRSSDANSDAVEHAIQLVEAKLR